jgi:hypothetical protein
MDNVHTAAENFGFGRDIRNLTARPHGTLEKIVVGVVNKGGGCGPTREFILAVDANSRGQPELI